jgi:hypothetical protein
MPTSIVRNTNHEQSIAGPSWLCVLIIVSLSCALHTAVNCFVSAVCFTVFVYHCEVCYHIQLRTWILRYCINGMEGYVNFTCFVAALVNCVAFRMEWGVMSWYRWLVYSDTCFSGPKASNLFMATVHTRYYGLVRRLHVESWQVMFVTS